MSLRIILIVDDNEDSRIVFSIILQRAGYLTILGRDGLEGLHLARTHHPDAVVADLHLPKLDGAELIAALRANPRTASIPALLITADASAGAPPSSEAFGNSEVVLKPCTPGELLEAIDRCLAPGRGSPSRVSVRSDARAGAGGNPATHPSREASPCASH